MKHFILKQLSVVIFLSLGINTFGTEVTINDVKYSLSGNEATVVGVESNMSELNIPKEIQYNNISFTVTKISRYIQFADRSSLVSLVAPETLTEVEGEDLANNNKSFIKCTNLERVYLPGVKSIGGSAFLGCSKLKNIYLGTKLKFISRYAFGGCSSITYIVLPATLIDFNNYIFYECSLLQNIIFLGKDYGKGGSNAKTWTVKDLLTWNESNFAYTGKSPSPSFTNKAPAGFSPTIQASTFRKDAGSYTDSIPVTFTNSDMSFNIKIPYTYTISRAKLTAVVQNATKTYGDNNPIFKVTYTGFVNEENDDVLDTKGVFNCSANSSSDVGTYPIALTNISAKNYDITKMDGVLTITKASLSAQPNNSERVYGANNPIFTIKYTGLKNAEEEPIWISKPSVETNATKYSDVGTYGITIVGGEAKNYNLNKSSGTLTVNKAELKITANNASRLYYEDNPKLTCFYDGFVNNENEDVLISQPVLSTPATKISDAGTYPITVKNANAKNYRINFVSGLLTVGKQKLTVSTENYTRTYLEANPTFTLQYVGFVNNENANNLLIKPKATTIATQQSDAGTYDIDVSGGAATNYEFYYNGGTLTIEKAYQTITWNQDLSNIVQYAQVELTSTASSGLPVSYYVENEAICSVIAIGSKKYLDCFGTGETIIYAKQEGNNNYYETTKTYKAINIISTSGIKDVSYIDNYIKIVNSKLYVSNLPNNSSLKIYDYTGNLIYEGKDSEISVNKGLYIVSIGKWTKKISIK